MSRSFGVKILLPMDQYNSDEVYAADERLEKDSSDKEDGKYYKTLKIRSTYASTNDIRAYLMGKYGLSEEDFRNYSASYRFGYDPADFLHRLLRFLPVVFIMDPNGCKFVFYFRYDQGITFFRLIRFYCLPNGISYSFEALRSMDLEKRDFLRILMVMCRISSCLPGRLSKREPDVLQAAIRGITS